MGNAIPASSIVLHVQTHPLGRPLGRCAILTLLRVVLLVPLLVQVPQQDVLLLCDDDLLQYNRNNNNNDFRIRKIKCSHAVSTSEGISSVGR